MGRLHEYQSNLVGQKKVVQKFRTSQMSVRFLKKFEL